MNDTELRDALAVERTRLANERTLLAYVRTALALLAACAALLQFFPERMSLSALAWLLGASGGAMLLIGVIRFIQVNRQLARGL